MEATFSWDELGLLCPKLWSCYMKPNRQIFGVSTRSHTVKKKPCNIILNCHWFSVMTFFMSSFDDTAVFRLYDSVLTTVYWSTKQLIINIIITNTILYIIYGGKISWRCHYLIDSHWWYLHLYILKLLTHCKFLEFQLKQHITQILNCWN